MYRSSKNVKCLWLNARKMLKEKKKVAFKDIKEENIKEEMCSFYGSEDWKF